MAFCFAHPTIEATGSCDDCKQSICANCTKGTLEGLMCPTCAARRYGKRKLVTGLKIGALAAVVIGGVITGFVLIGRSNSDRPATTAKAPEGEMDPYIELLRKERDKAPCDQAGVRKLVMELNQMKRHAEAVTDAGLYFAACAPFPRLKWDVIYALQQLGRYAEAVKLETELLADDYNDSDFWWWRGEDRGHIGEHIQALADFRQSFANSEDAGYSRFPAGRIMDVAVPADRPCEAVAALDYFAGFHDGRVGSDLEQKTRDLDLNSRCEGKRGRGHAELPARGDKPVTIKVTIGGVEGNFLIEETCGTTAVTPAFAQRAQLTPRPTPTVQTVAGGAIRTGPLAIATVAFADATAPDSELVIVDGLPAEADGVLGMSVLWKFELVRRDDGGLNLTGAGK
jgi:hypothetical protein